jgi:uncharacterized protein
VSSIFSPLRLNVGFVVRQSIGFSRDFDFALPTLSLPPDLVLNDLEGTAHVSRTPQGLLAQVQLQATMPVECVRCLTPLVQPLTTDFTELYAFSQRFATESGLILPEDGNINLEPLVREYMLLEVPINPLCKPDCKGLCPICGKDLNEETCNHEASESVP